MVNRIFSIITLILGIFVISFLVFSFQACKQDFIEPGENVVRFPPEIEALFNTPLNPSGVTCATSACHGIQSPASGLDLVDWKRTMEGSVNGTMVIPYNGFFSHLTSVINTDTLVAPVAEVSLSEFHKLDSPKVALIMNWINDGAKSINGDVAFTQIENSGFITNQASDLIAVLDTRKRLVTRLIPVGGRDSILDAPHYITSDPQKQFLFVSLIQEGFLEKFDANSYQKVGRVATSSSPAHIVISPNGEVGYVTNFDATGSVRAVKKFTTNPLNIIDMATHNFMVANHGMALSSNGEFLYVASQIGEYLFKIYASDMSILEFSPVDPSVPPTGNGTGNFKPYQIEISPDDSLLFVTLAAANQVRIYDASTLSQVNAIPVGSNPLLLKFTPNGEYLFVCNRNSNSVTVIHRSTQSVLTTVTNVGIQPHGVDYTSDGKLAYIACETLTGFDGHHPVLGSVKPGISRIINVDNFTLQDRRLEMGSFPAGIVILR